MIVLLALLVPVSAIAAWSDLEVGDTGRFISTVAPLDSDPHVRQAVADRITDEVMTQVRVGPLHQSVRSLLHEAVLSFATTEAFKNAWRTAARAVHSAAAEVLSGDHSNGKNTPGGHRKNGQNDRTVTIDLAPIAEQVKRQLVTDHVPFANRIPVRHTEITVLESNGLGVWRVVAQGLRTAGIWPAVGTVVLAAVALLLAADRRRALIRVGAAFTAGAALLVIAVAVARGSVLADLPNNGDRSAARALYDALTVSLRTAAWSVLAAGPALALGAWLTGRRRAPRHPAPPPSAPTAPTAPTPTAPRIPRRTSRRPSRT
ncbi:hypothetical protein DVK44_14970 [Streptomyces paludis]|uniref:Integral membrane protein n=1 Tax=Streptomyces paludis TaxID=2282738 RepID=A0A345I0Y1_9ACTN|nr:hypothetical protein DVK44_14970 [Streptomyces paludis]